MNIKKFIIQIIPFGLYKWFQKRRYHNLFLEKFKDFVVLANKEIEFHDGKKSYESIVSVQGLGFSGSGAVLDLLSEVETCDVIGTIYDDTVSDDHKGQFECDFLRLSGCLFEIEKYIDSSNIFQNDALLNRFVDYLNEFPLFQSNKQTQQLFLKFFKNIVEFQILDIKGTPYNHHLRGNKDGSAIFFLKHLKITEYRCLCRNFLTELFNTINVQGKAFLVFDQLLGDFEYDSERYQEYIPDAKIILVFRDPRDIYTFATQHVMEEGWMANRNVDDFIVWYKILTRNITKDKDNMLLVRFESLIENYDYEKKRIFNFIGIDENDSIKRSKSFFNPAKSKKNIGIWKSNNNIPMSDFDKIAVELKDFCFFN